MVEYRYELKFLISQKSADLLKKQLSQVMSLDEHSVSSEYSYDIRSLYFDDPYSSAMDEKIDGVLYRSKYRMRIYNYSDEVIKLECKYKEGNMTYKKDCSISRKTADAIIAGRYNAIVSNKEFLNTFLANARIKMLKPAVIVDYRRTAFTYPVSETRITFDENIRSGRYDLNLFDRDVDLLSVCDDVVMEVKCDEFIPAHIIAILSSEPKLRVAVSKFALCGSVR